MSSKLAKISTDTYSGKLDEILDNGTEVYLKAKLTKRLTYGEYVGEPKNGFELVLGDTVKILNLDEINVFCRSGGSGMKPKEFMNQKVYYESDIRLRGWSLVKYMECYTNGVSNSLWRNNDGKEVRLLVY